MRLTMEQFVLMKKQQERQNKYLITQANELIEATYPTQLPARAHKIARLIISLINPADNELQPYKVSIGSLKEYLGYSPNTTWGRFYADLNDIADRLNSVPFYIKTKDKLIKAYFVSAYEIDLTNQTVEFEIPRKLKPYLCKLKGNHTTYQLQNIPKLKSAYSIRMFELLSQYKKIGSRTFDLEELKNYLGASNYKQYGHFKSKVLKISQRDLEKHTTIKFTYKEIKDKRKVVKLIFSIKKNSPKESIEKISEQFDIFSETIVDTINQDVVTEFESVGIPQDSTINLYEQGFAIIAEDKVRAIAIERTENNITVYFQEKLELLKQKKKTKNPAGFLISALKQDWQSPQIVEEKQAAKSRTETAKMRKAKEKLEAELEGLKVERSDHSFFICQSIINNNENWIEEIYKPAKLRGGVLANTMFPSKTEPIKIFNDRTLGYSIMLSILLDKYPDKFEKVQKQYDQKIENIEDKLRKYEFV